MLARKGRNPNDFALLKLDKAVKITDKIYPICLGHESNVTVGGTALAIGYGNYRDNLDDETKQDLKLRKVTVPIQKCPDNLPPVYVCTSDADHGLEGVSKCHIHSVVKIHAKISTDF